MSGYEPQYQAQQYEAAQGGQYQEYQPQGAVMQQQPIQYQMAPPPQQQQQQPPQAVMMQQGGMMQQPQQVQYQMAPQEQYVMQQGYEQSYAPQQQSYAPQQAFAPQQSFAPMPMQQQQQAAPADSAWDDFNRRRNAAIRTTGFTTKESAKMPAGMQQAQPQAQTMMMSGQSASYAPPGAISQDAANAYLQSIGVSPAAAPQFAAPPQEGMQMQYVQSQPQFAPQQYVQQQPSAFPPPVPPQQYAASTPLQGGPQAPPGQYGYRTYGAMAASPPQMMRQMPSMPQQPQQPQGQPYSHQQ
ncbi:hypothetical protein T484DRAFT_2021395, partial [Baffinella frigidus]